MAFVSYFLCGGFSMRTDLLTVDSAVMSNILALLKSGTCSPIELNNPIIVAIFPRYYYIHQLQQQQHSVNINNRYFNHSLYHLHINNL